MLSWLPLGKGTTGDSWENFTLILFGLISFLLYLCSRHSMLPFLRPFPTSLLLTEAWGFWANTSQRWGPNPQRRGKLCVILESQGNLSLRVGCDPSLTYEMIFWEPQGEFASLIRRNYGASLDSSTINICNLNWALALGVTMLCWGSGPLLPRPLFAWVNIYEGKEICKEEVLWLRTWY